MKMTGNTILITGATTGIGRALAEAFHDRGNRVIVTGRRQALLDQITAERPDMIGLALDLADPSSLPRFSAEIRASFPELNVLIANAGISRAEDITADGWDTADAEAIVATNILGVLRVTAAVLPLLKWQPNATIMATSFEPRFRAPRRLPGLLCQQGVPALLASVAAASASQDPRRGAGARTALCADRAHRHATGARYARDAASPPISRRSCNCWSWGPILAARCWSSATAPAAGPSATAATRPPSRP